MNKIDDCWELRMELKSVGALHLYTRDLEALDELSTTKSLTKITLDGSSTHVISLRVLSCFYYLEELWIESNNVVNNFPRSKF